MVFSENGWQETPNASAAVIRVLQNKDNSFLYPKPESSDDPAAEDIIVSWALVVDASGVETLFSKSAEEYYSLDSIKDNVDTKYRFALEDLKEQEKQVNYSNVLISFINNYLYNSVFVVLVDEFRSKEQAIEFAKSQLGKKPTASNAEGKDPWLN